VLTQKIGDETAVSIAWVKMSWVYSVLPISGALMLLVSAGEIVRLVLGLQPGAAEHGAAGDEAEKGQIAWLGSSSE
jgi:TRAP-type C4-dicarboxylate transport system permease small subunit